MRLLYKIIYYSNWDIFNQLHPPYRLTATKTPYLNHFGMACLLGCLFFLTFGRLAMAGTDIEQEVRFDSVEVLSKVKTRAESRVKLVRSLLEDGEIQKKDLKKIQILYGDTRAEVNAGLDRLLIEMESTGSQGEVEPYARVAKKAGKQAGEFIDACDKLILGEDRGVLEASSAFIDTFVGALVDIWKTYRDDRSARNSQVRDRIELMKWEKFDKID